MMKKESWLSTALVVTLCATTLASGAQAATTINLGEGHSPAISSDGQGHFYVVFEGVNDRGVADIFYSSSNDGGRTWTKRLDVSPTSGVSTGPKVAIEKDGAIDVVWADTASGDNSPDIFFTRSTDGGHTWNNPIDISNTKGVSREPVVAVGSDNSIHVAFTENGNAGNGEAKRDVFYASSNDGGKTWSQPIQNVSNTPGDSYEPTIAIGADGIVHVAWKDDSAADLIPQIYYSQRAQGTWSAPANVSKSLQYSFRPAIACGSTGRTYITWSDRATVEGVSDIWCIASANNGLFANPIKITNGAGLSSEAAIAADRTDRVAIAWPDRALGLKRPRICSKVLSSDLREYDRSIKFSHSPSVQMAPDVVIDGDKLIVVWEERRLGTTPIKVRAIDLRNITIRTAKIEKHREASR